MKRLLLLSLVSVLALLVAVPALAGSAVFISEYVEGSSYNKAIEIYNGTDTDIDLAAEGYKLLLYYNGATTLGSFSVVTLSGTLASQDVHVAVNNQCTDATLIALADEQPANLQFNGDDAVLLVRGEENVLLDAIGQVGFDPGAQWGTDPTSTADNTIRRKASVCRGDLDPFDVFDPSVEWDGYDTNVFDGLGTHIANCTVVPTASQTWGRVKTLYR